MNLPSYLRQKFPSLPLASPLFYNWPIGLRFELGDPTDEGPVWESTTYFEALHLRARTLFETAFAPEDVCIVASVEHRNWKMGRNPRRRDTLFHVARWQNLGIGRPSGRVRRPEPKAERTISMDWAETSRRQLDYDTILRRIARTDFPVFTGGFAGDVFLINLSRNVIFHMYDDRGLDLIATKLETLAPIYNSHNAWLLDYARARMDRAFNGSTNEAAHAGHPAFGVVPYQTS